MTKVAFKNPIEKEFGKIFDDLVFLNFNYDVLRLITSFPWDALRLRLHHNNFILFCVKNSLDYSVIIIRRIYYDTKPHSVTIPHLHNKIFYNSVKKKPGTQKDRDRIKEIKNTLKLHEETINYFRNRELAHFFNDPNFKLDKVFRFSISEIGGVVELMNEYLRLLRRLYDKGGYLRFTPYRRKVGPTDIKRVLDNIAKESEVLTYKENEPSMWSAHVRHLKKENKLDSDLEIINQYRVRLLKLPPIILE